MVSRRRSRIRRCGRRSSTTGRRRPTPSAIPSRRATSGTPRWETARRRSGRTSRAPTRTRSWSRSTRAARSSIPSSTTSTSSPCAASSWRTPPALDPADGRPAGPHRPELGEGLDHRGQPHPRREVLGRLPRQGGLDGPQPRDPAQGQARLPVPARVRVHRPPDRLGQGARRLAHRPPEHHLRLRPERHRRPPRLRVLDDRGQPHLQHRPQARVLRLRDRRHQAARGHRRRHPPQPHPRLLARDVAGLADAGHPRHPEPLLRQQPRPLRRGEPRAVPRRPQRPRLARVAGGVQPGRRLRQQPGVRHRVARARRRAADALPPAAQHPGRRLRRDPRRRRPPRRQRLPRRRRGPAYGPEARCAEAAGYGTAGYDGHPASLADYLTLVDDPSRGDHERFTDVKQPVFIRDNVYAAGARPFEAEQDPLVLDAPRCASPWSTRARRSTSRRSCRRRSTTRASGSSPDGTSSASASWTRSSRTPTDAPRSLDTDLVGARKTDGQAYPAGPVAGLASGSTRTRVW